MEEEKMLQLFIRGQITDESLQQMRLDELKAVAAQLSVDETDMGHRGHKSSWSTVIMRALTALAQGNNECYHPDGTEGTSSLQNNV